MSHLVTICYLLTVAVYLGQAPQSLGPAMAIAPATRPATQPSHAARAVVVISAGGGGEMGGIRI